MTEKPTNDIASIETSDGVFAIIDKKDYQNVSKFKWNAYKDKRYEKAWRITTTIRSGGKRKNIYLSRFILGVENPKIFVDHKNHNGLDNRRSNLRLCNYQQNNANHSPKKGQKYTGVSYKKSKKKWVAQISDGKGNCTHIGLFKTEKEAAIAYNKRASKQWGEFAYQNKVED